MIPAIAGRATCRMAPHNARATHLVNVADDASSARVTGIPACDRHAAEAELHFIGRTNAAGQVFRDVVRMNASGLPRLRPAPADTPPCVRCGSTSSSRSAIDTVAGPKVYCHAARPCELRARRRRGWL
jgi:hypothetical protein